MPSPVSSSLQGSIEAKPPKVLFIDYGPNQTVDNNSSSAGGAANSSSENKPVMGMFRHLNERSKQWETKEKASPVSMSLCRHLFHDQMSRKDARRVFHKHKVELSQITSGKRPEAIFTHENALYRINGDTEGRQLHHFWPRQHR